MERKENTMRKAQFNHVDPTLKFSTTSLVMMSRRRRLLLGSTPSAPSAALSVLMAGMADKDSVLCMPSSIGTSQ